MRKILYGFGGAATAADPIGDIEALLPAGSYFWLGDDAVPTSGSGTITAWVDRVQSFDIAVTVTATPTVADDATLGKRVVQFGLNEAVISTATMSLSQPYTFFYVINYQATSGFRYVLNANTLPAFGQNGDRCYLRCNTALQTGAGVITASSWVTYAGLANGASSEIWENAISDTTGNAGANAFSADTLGLGSAANGPDMHLAAVILANGDLSSDLSSIHTHFDTYYGGALP